MQYAHVLLHSFWPLLKRKPAQAGPAPASLDSDKPLLKSRKRKMMFVPFVAGMLFSRKRKAIEILPESVKTLWNKWELRSMVIFSLFLQGILMVLGKSRKHSRRNWVRIILWLAYLWADTVATASLGVLSSNQGESEGGFVDPNYVITVFWAPFLLLHLGGPDTITAYSLEDNELWLRHLLGLLVQVGGSIYVFLSVWKSTNALYFMAIPIFFAGIIKYGERTWVLMSASSEHFRDSMLPPPDPGPNYARFVEEYMSKEKEGFKVCSENNPEDGKEDDYSSPDAETANSRIPEAAVICKAYMFFKIFKRLPANLILSFHSIQKSQYIMRNISADEAFKVIEVELGFMYDMFYTKAVLVYSVVGRLLHFVPFICTVSLFVIFLKTEKHIYSGVDVAITYTLLVGAILLEIYAAVVLVCSDWTILWLSQHGISGDILYRVISLIPWPRKKRWSNAMGHFNLVRYCLKEKPAMCTFKQRFLWISKLLEKYRYHNSVEVPLDLKAIIFDELQRKMKANLSVSHLRNLKELCACRGDKVIEENANTISAEMGDENFNILKRSVEEEFDQSILLWHIATDLCYYWDRDENPLSVCDLYCKASKLLSDYMMYLLVICPFMLPNGIGETRVRDTCAELHGFCKERISIKNESQACSKLNAVKTKIPPSKVKGDRSKSVLFDACRLAKSLQSLNNPPKKEKKWKLVLQVWVEMLSYAACQCGWTDHAQQLRRGGELLTHVWLLMAHFGITQQFQISEGNAKVKLNWQ